MQSAGAVSLLPQTMKRPSSVNYAPLPTTAAGTLRDDWQFSTSKAAWAFYIAIGIFILAITFYLLISILGNTAFGILMDSTSLCDDGRNVCIGHRLEFTQDLRVDGTLYAEILRANAMYVDGASVSDVFAYMLILCNNNPSLISPARCAAIRAVFS